MKLSVPSRALALGGDRSRIASLIITGSARDQEWAGTGTGREARGNGRDRKRYRTDGPAIKHIIKALLKAGFVCDAARTPGSSRRNARRTVRVLCARRTPGS